MERIEREKKEEAKDKWANCVLLSNTLHGTNANHKLFILIQSNI
jgi:hypothetical protein